MEGKQARESARRKEITASGASKQAKQTDVHNKQRETSARSSTEDVPWGGADVEGYTEGGREAGGPVADDCGPAKGLMVEPRGVCCQLPPLAPYCIPPSTTHST